MGLGITLSHWAEWFDAAFNRFVDTIILKVLFFDAQTGMPLIVLWLMVAALFFTLRMGFINLRGFGHAIAILRGKYDQSTEEGEVSHFQAVATALSATVGLGNIAGVAIAIQLGGVGAVFWMTIAGFLGMTSKFVECTLAQKYRTIKPDGTAVGGPMYYLSQGLTNRGLPRLGRGLAFLFSFFCVCGALGGTTLFQANQSYQAIQAVVPYLAQHDWLYGLFLAGLVGCVVLGGIQRIGQVTSFLVPGMCALYVGASLWIIGSHWADLPGAFSTIITEAFVPHAVEGGLVGVLVQGLRRSAFSNEAGIGSAAIAHAAARTQEPIREGIVALLEPFIDTVVICNMTALVIVTTGVYRQPEFQGMDGAQLTGVAFGSVISWFPVLLAIAIFCFAFSTIISWGYYGQQGWDYLFGEAGATSQRIYKILLLVAVFFGAIASPLSVINFGDGMLLAMAFPNVLGLYILSGEIAVDLKQYMERLRSGAFTPCPSVSEPIKQPKVIKD
jgi:AGCS family alanine or glycine:cation symporter